MEEANRELEHWKKLRRLEKIKVLQKKWNKDVEKTPSKEGDRSIDREKNWNV